MTVTSSFEREARIDACVGATAAATLAAGFAAKGVEFSMLLRKMPYGTEFYVRDPDGYILGFIETAAE